MSNSTVPGLSFYGTGIVNLIEQRTAVIDEIKTTIQTLSAMAPQVKDYVGRPECLAAAEVLHEQRMAMLQNLRSDVTLEREQLSRICNQEAYAERRARWAKEDAQVGA